MSMIETGTEIKIPCEIAEGAFPKEHFVTFNTKTGPVSGFVASDQIETDDQGNTFLIGSVIDVDEDTITVRIEGEFFTTTGLAYLSPSSDLVAA